MRTMMNFTLAILLLIAFLGSGAFFVLISKDLKLERRSEESALPATSAPAPPAEPPASE
ncbi:hypothetical protein [Roseibacillus ishigakijimensis]|nr:hypothetical protein [Roseibacillus ishigakijimensis]